MTYEIAFIGLIISLAFIALTRYYPGGIIVPSYLVLFVDQPLRLLGTLIAAFLAVLLYRLISKYTIVYGKRRFVLMILLGSVFSFILSFIAPIFYPLTLELRVIGWVIPGLIANTFERQGFLVTTAAMALTVTIIYFIGQLYFLLI